MIEIFQLVKGKESIIFLDKYYKRDDDKYIKNPTLVKKDNVYYLVDRKKMKYGAIQI